MNKKTLIKLICCFSFLPSLCNAADESIMDFHEETSNGKTIGCALIFNATTSDFAYKGGVPIYVRGSIVYRGLGWAFKLVVNDLSESLDSIANNSSHLLKSEPVNYAYLKPTKCRDSNKNRCQSSAGTEIKFTESEKGGFLGVYKLENIAFMEATLGTGNIEIGFNREKAGLDVKFILDKKEKENAKAIASYRQCVVSFLEETEKELRSTKR
jgi:hypothetical protein